MLPRGPFRVNEAQDCCQGDCKVPFAPQKVLCNRPGKEEVELRGHPSRSKPEGERLPPGRGCTPTNPAFIFLASALQRALKIEYSC